MENKEEERQLLVGSAHSINGNPLQNGYGSFSPTGSDDDADVEDNGKKQHCVLSVDNALGQRSLHSPRGSSELASFSYTSLNVHDQRPSGERTVLWTIPRHLLQFVFHTNLSRQFWLNLCCLRAELTKFRTLSDVSLELSNEDDALNRLSYCFCDPLWQDMPLPSNGGQTYAKFWDAFFAGTDDFRHTIYPRVLTFSTLYEIVLYYALPSERYGNTLLKLLSGFAPNELSLSSALSRYPNVYFPMALLSLWMLKGLYRGVRSFWDTKAKRHLLDSAPYHTELPSCFSKYFGNTFGNATFQEIQVIGRLLRWDASLTEAGRLELLNHLSRFLTRNTGNAITDEILREYAKISASLTPSNFAQLSLSQQKWFLTLQGKADTELENHSTRLAAQYALFTLGKKSLIEVPLVLLPLLFQLWYQYRFYLAFVLAAQTFYQAYEFEQNCEADGNEAMYSFALGRMHCALCHNTPLSLQNDPQSCLDAFLATAQTEAAINQTLPRMLRYETDMPANTLPLSAQNWTAWNQSDWHALSQHLNGSHITRLTFVDQTGKNHTLLFGTDFIDFLNAQNPEALDFSGVKIADANFAANDTATWQALNIPALRTLLLPESNLADKILPPLTELPLTHLNLSHIVFNNETALRYFFENAEIPAETIDLSGIQFRENATFAVLANYLSGSNTVRLPKIESPNEASVLSTALSQMENVYIGGQGMTQYVAETLFSKTGGALKSLDVSGNRIYALNPIVHQNGLETFRVDDSQVPFSDFPAFPLSREDTAIASLSFQEASLDAESFAQIGNLTFTDLSALDLSGNPSLKVDNRSIAFLANQIHLKQLNLGNTQLDSNAAIQLFNTFAALPHVPTELSLSGATLQDKSIIAIRDFIAAHPEITALDLSHTEINNDQLQLLLPVLNVSQIERISLAHTAVTSPGLQALLSSLPKTIVSLDFSHLNLPEDFGDQVAESFVESFAHDERFGNPNISGDLQQAIRGAFSRFPNLASLSMNNCGQSTQSLRALYRVLHKTAMMPEDLALADNSAIEWSEVNPQTGEVLMQTHQTSWRLPGYLPRTTGLFGRTEPRAQSLLILPHNNAESNTGFRACLGVLSMSGALGAVFQDVPIFEWLLLAAVISLFLYKRRANSARNFETNTSHENVMRHV